MTKEPYTKPDTKEKVSHKDTSLKEAAEMALEALQYTCDYLPVKTATERQVDEAITALQVALSTEGNTKRNLVKTYCGGKPNYCVDAVNMSQECVDETAKDGHKWVGLTDQDIDLYALDIGVDTNKAPPWLVRYARDIEARLKEKNT